MLLILMNTPCDLHYIDIFLGMGPQGSPRYASPPSAEEGDRGLCTLNEPSSCRLNVLRRTRTDNQDSDIKTIRGILTEKTRLALASSTSNRDFSAPSSSGPGRASRSPQLNRRARGSLTRAPRGVLRYQNRSRSVMRYRILTKSAPGR